MKSAATLLGVIALCAGVTVAGGGDRPGADAAPVRCAGEGSMRVGEGTSLRTDPAGIVAALYAGQGLDFNGEAGAIARPGQTSKRLSAVYAQSQRDYDGFALTFDPVVNGQDALIEDLVIHPALIDADHAYVTVRFLNFGTDNVLVFSFVCEDRAWRVDEIASIGGDTRWVLSEVLRNP